MPDPITPTLPDPQASVDAALGSITAPTPTTPTPNVAEPVKVEVPLAPVMNAPMGDDTPLAFAAPTLNAMTTPPSTPEPTPAPTIVPEAPKLEPMPRVGSSYLPPVPPAPISTPPVEDKPKSKFSFKVAGIIVGVLALLGGIGYGGWYFYFTNYSEPAKIAGVFTDNADKASCDGCHNGGWLVWRNGSCKVSGICGSTVPNKNTDNPNAETTYNSQGTCNGSGKGYVWCSSVDSTGKAYAFCNTKGIGCNEAAVQEGYTIVRGTVKCDCKTKDPITGACIGGYTTSTSMQWDPNTNAAQLEKEKAAVEKQCNEQKMGTGSFICKEGVMGGSIKYTGGECTALNGKAFTGNLGCFCGTVQVDTGTGHTSYTSTCGCNNADENPVTHKACNVTTKVCETVTGPGADTCTTDANCVTAAPALACTGLTNTPAAPVIGQTVTFTCAGTITPTGAATLSYKFKYSLNDGADQLLANKTNTTAELPITACGTYSVQCKVCATIAGVLKCDPTWTGAIQ